MGDWELLQAYATQESEAAFAELVRRHLNWVHSSARRQVGDAQADDVTQAVFVLLARKAGSLRSGTIVSGWLFRTTRFVAARALRTERRRKNREEAAFAMSLTAENANPWEQLVPHLDQAVAALSAADRSAILLRFYEQKSLREVGEQLGLSEEAARKRVSRAVEKLGAFMTRRGVAFGGAALAVLLSENTVEAAPAALAIAIANASVAGASALLPRLVRESLRAWRSNQIKIAALAATVIAIIAVALSVGVFSRQDSTSASKLDGVVSSQVRAGAPTSLPSGSSRTAAVQEPITDDSVLHKLAGNYELSALREAWKSVRASIKSGQITCEYTYDSIASPEQEAVARRALEAQRQEFLTSGKYSASEIEQLLPQVDSRLRDLETGKLLDKHSSLRRTVLFDRSKNMFLDRREPMERKKSRKAVREHFRGQSPLSTDDTLSLNLITKDTFLQYTPRISAVLVSKSGGIKEYIPTLGVLDDSELNSAYSVVSVGAANDEQGSSLIYELRALNGASKIKIGVDPKMRSVYRRVEFFENDVLVREITASDYRWLGGVPFPMFHESTTYEKDAEHSIASRETWKILSAEFNHSIPPEAFDFQLPPGASISDRRNESFAHLDEPVPVSVYKLLTGEAQTKK